MIHDNQKFVLPDQNKSNQFLMEVNWNPNDPKTNRCQIVKLIAPNGQEAFIKRENLHAILFAIGKPEEQSQLVPHRQERIRNIETTLGIKATKDIAKGEMINVAVKIPIPLGSDEIIGTTAKESKLLTLRS